MYNCHMPKRLSDLPSQGAALSAAIARQQLDLRKISRVVDTRSIFRDLERMQRIAGASSTVRDLERIQRTAAVSSAVRGLERIQRVAVSSSVFRDVRRIGMALSENNIAKDCQRIAEALQTQQQRAISAQRLLLRSTAFDALKRIKRATELRQRQLRSIALTVSTSPFANAVERMNLAFSGSAFAKDFQRITDAGRLMQAQVDAARRTLRAVPDFSPMERMGFSLSSGLRQSLTAAAETVPFPSPQDAKEAARAANIDNAAAASSSDTVGAVSEEAHIEWKITVFVAKLPTYFPPLEDPPPKHRLH
ncbi:MAG: hypothetical protein F4109_03590 [Gammaproteobacteria bacterium]|nr:hypothetical protein [Gammaproteobacteria bacterium]